MTILRNLRNRVTQGQYRQAFQKVATAALSLFREATPQAYRGDFMEQSWRPAWLSWHKGI